MRQDSSRTALPGRSLGFQLWGRKEVAQNATSRAKMAAAPPPGAILAYIGTGEAVNPQQLRRAEGPCMPPGEARPSAGWGRTARPVRLAFNTRQVPILPSGPLRAAGRRSRAGRGPRRTTSCARRLPSEPRRAGGGPLRTYRGLRRAGLPATSTSSGRAGRRYLLHQPENICLLVDLPLLLD